MTRPDGKPSKEQVKQKILEVFSEHKSINNKKRAVLLYKSEKENCYCIEGVFCEAGRRLGFEGFFEYDSDGKYCYARLENGEQVRYGNAPPEVFAFLGLPFTITRDALKKHDPTMLEKVDNLANLIWSNVHDSSRMSLKRLVNLSISLLKEDENVS